MLLRVMDFLVCPVCRLPLQLKIDEQKEIQRDRKNLLPACRRYCEVISKELSSSEVRKEAYFNCSACYKKEITEGRLMCRNGHAFSITGAVPRLYRKPVNHQRTKQTFDVEWNVFKYNEKIYGHSPEEEFHDLLKRMVIDEAFFQEKTILDAGCGIGRITQSVAKFANEVVGVDFSQGVDEAYLLNENNLNVHIIQADIMNLPFKESSFDYVYSKGVLHYVSDVKKCLAELTSLVIPGGALSVTIYSKMSCLFEIFNALIRKFALCLPVKAIYILSYLLIPFLVFAWKWSGVKQRKIDWDESAHMIFNWLSSEFQNKTTDEEAVEWFTDLGFSDIRLSDIPVGITGIKKA